MMNLLVVGSRSFNDFELMKRKVEFVVNGVDEVQLISGGARGADKLAEVVGKDMMIPVKVFPADWAGQGRKAGFVRNVEMANFADKVIAFWDGESRGTRHMIMTMIGLKKEVLIVTF